MPLTRATVTAASRVMLPLYPALYLGVGIAFLAQDAARTSGPAFDVAKMVMPIPAWGALFVAVAVVEIVALLAHHRAAYQLALIPGAWLAGFWAVVVLGSAVASPFVSYTSGMWVAGMAVAQAASARSLARHETTA
jgi:hypothetical protein